MSGITGADELAHSSKAPPPPVITPDSLPFWNSVRAHQIELPRCGPCGRFFFPPADFCPNCWNDQVTWEAIRGTGTVFSYVTFRRMYHPAFADLIPYHVVLVEVDEGPRILSRLSGGGEPSVGDRVVIVYEDIDSSTTLPLFRFLDQEG